MHYAIMLYTNCMNDHFYVACMHVHSFIMEVKMHKPQDVQSWNMEDLQCHPRAINSGSSCHNTPTPVAEIKLCLKVWTPDTSERVPNLRYKGSYILCSDGKVIICLPATMKLLPPLDWYAALSPPYTCTVGEVLFWTLLGSAKGKRDCHSWQASSS